MKNRSVGFIIIGIAILIGFIIFSFNNAMIDIVGATCTHGSECVMWSTIDFQTNVSLGVMGFVVIIGVYLIFFGKEEKIITRIKKVHEQIKPEKITKENYQKIMEDMENDEKDVFSRIIDAEGSIAQSELVKNTGFSKVRVSRILDRLEGRRLIERKRRGMTNIIVLKH